MPPIVVTFALAATFVRAETGERRVPDDCPARAPLALPSVDLTTATAAELAELPRIGPALAERIVADRGRNGPFRTVDELARVKGIGPATVARLRGRVVAGGPPDAGAGAGYRGVTNPTAWQRE